MPPTRATLYDTNVLPGLDGRHQLEAVGTALDFGRDDDPAGQRTSELGERPAEPRHTPNPTQLSTQPSTTISMTISVMNRNGGCEAEDEDVWHHSASVPRPSHCGR
jgi:hypothetical protein